MQYLQFVVPINPIPWKTPPFSVGRNSAGKQFVRAGKDQELAAYQDGVREFLTGHPDYEMLYPPYRVQLWFSRRQDEYVAHSGRKSKQHEADATNMQKATEDALQGTVIGNDNDVVQIYSTIIEQGPQAKGLVIIEVWGEAEPEIPPYIKLLRDISGPHVIISNDGSNNAWPPTT